MDERAKALLGISGSFDGHADEFGFSVNTVTFRGGAEATFLGKGVSVVVGGNNVGKSSLLRDLDVILRTHEFQEPKLSVIASASVERYGNASDALDWFAKHTDIDVSHNQPSFLRKKSPREQPQVAAAEVQNSWLWRNGTPSTEARIGPMAALMVYFASSRERFDFTGTVARRKDVNDAPSHPLHILERSREMLDELNDILSFVFGARVTFDRVSGNLGLRYGEVIAEIPRADNLTPEYINELASLPHLATQGDGFVSAVGLLLPLIASWE